MTLMHIRLCISTFLETYFYFTNDIYTASSSPTCPQRADYKRLPPKEVNMAGATFHKSPDPRARHLFHGWSHLRALLMLWANMVQYHSLFHTVIAHKSFLTLV